MSNMLANIDLSDRIYYLFTKLVYDTAGIHLGDAKRELVRSRLLKRLRKLSIGTFEHYYEYVCKDSTGKELAHMIDAISTNKTDFFRENQHFQFLAETVLPALADKIKCSQNGRIRIWSAGCSSGEEPYTLAMLLRDELDAYALRDAKILATDISTQMLSTAVAGVYEESKIAPVPARLRSLFLKKESTLSGVQYRMGPEIRKMITFRRLNLMDAKFPFSGKFDIIFCRNVMIYFDKPTQEELVNKYFNCLHKGGYLFIGHSESLNSLKTPFRFVKPTIYLHA